MRLVSRQNRRLGQGYQINPTARCPLPWVGRCYQGQCPLYAATSSGEIWPADPGGATKIERGGCRVFNVGTAP